MKLLNHALFVLTLLGHVAISHAQSSSDDIFTPREMVIFSDDFSQDPVGSFPQNWEVVKCNIGGGKGSRNNGKGRRLDTSGFFEKFDNLYYNLLKVKRENHLNHLEVKTCVLHLAPKLPRFNSLPDEFTLETVFFLASTFASVDLVLMPGGNDSGKYYHNCQKYMLRVMRWGAVRTSIGSFNEADTDISYPGTFDTTIWHHLGISYNRGEVKVYVDSFKMITIPRCGFVPTNILFGGWATVKYRNIRIATGPEATPIRQLLKGKPLTTHAILFDVGSAAIKTESNKYLEELAALLQANPKLKLNINGHTDSDGTDAENLVLSEKRAAAVKDFLTQKGIVASRLATKGMGESMPLKRGFTLDIKALNRRVEFVPR